MRFPHPKCCAKNHLADYPGFVQQIVALIDRMNITYITCTDEAIIARIPVFMINQTTLHVIIEDLHAFIDF